MRLRHWVITGLAAGWTFGAILSAVAPAQTSDAPANLAGVYDGGRPELAAGLELRADGRFRYGLSYGALDERAEGVWRVEGGQVLLTSDPVVPPRFVLVERRDRPDGRFRIVLDLPEGMSRQYFDAQFRFADNGVARQQLTEKQEAFRLQQPPMTVILSLPIFDVSSAPVPLAGAGGHELHFRFEPHDLGKVAFARTPLRIDKGDLILSRYDLAIRFRREVE